jgi:hypothetical protein
MNEELSLNSQLYLFPQINFSILFDENLISFLAAFLL